MLRSNQLVKSLAAVVVPSLLLALLVFQVYRCKSILLLRNSYLVESLPSSSVWIWDALSESRNSEIFLKGISDVNETSVDRGSRKDNHKIVLLPRIPSLTVHYLWCIDGHFEIGHYLLILSAIHQLQPDKVVIHYRTFPRIDPQGYWKWLEDLQCNVAMLSMRPLSNPQFCRHDLSAGIDYDHKDFPDPYGVFLLGDVTISNLTRQHVVNLMLKSFSLPAQNLETKKDSLKSQVFLVSDTEPYHISQSAGRVVIKCPGMSTLDTLQSLTDISCISINSYIQPETLFRQNSLFYRYARNVIYGSSEPIQVDMSPALQILNIVHIILIDGIGDITPLLYVSIKSAYVRGKADEVYIHGPNPPSGPLWDRLHNIDELSIRYIPSMSANEIDNKHAALMYALYILLQHGGIAHFGDVVFIKSFPISNSHASAVATLHYSEYRLKHRSINTAIIAGAKGSKFIESLLARIRQHDFTWLEARADDIATHVAEIFPSSVLLDAHLISHQKCSKSQCQVAGGHGHPQQSYTTRLIWQGEQPGTLEELKHIEGPSKKDIKDIIDSRHT